MISPLVTVFMPAYNAAPYIASAIGSILNQSFKDFELLIIDDGSTDDTAEIISTFSDNRIKYLKNENNAGISFTRNRGILEAKGAFIALLDADDVAYPERLETQVTFMQAHPDMAMCGSHADVIDQNGRSAGKKLLMPIAPDDIKVYLLFGNPFVNSTVMFRATSLSVIEGYYEGYSEDYELAIRINEHFRSANIDQTLVQYRVHGENISIRDLSQISAGERYCIAYMQKQLGMQTNDHSVDVHFSITARDKTGRFDIQTSEQLLMGIKQANESTKKYPKVQLDTIILRFWFQVIQDYGGRSAIFTFMRSPLFSWRASTFKMLRKMFKQSFWLHRRR